MKRPVVACMLPQTRKEEALPPNRPLAEALQRLEILKVRDDSKSFAPPAAFADIEAAAKKMGRSVPQDWGQALMVNAFSLPTYQEEMLQPYLEQKHSGFSQRFIFIGDSDCGDLYCLNPADDQCRVIMFSHETGRQKTEWPSVAEFILDILADD